MDPTLKVKLKRVVRKRLAEGQSAEALRAELESRISPEEAQALIDESSDVTAGRLKTSWVDYAAAIGVVLWVVLLLGQNIILIWAARGDSDNPLVSSFVFFAKVKIAVLVMASGFYAVTRSAARRLVLAAAILYVFPFGLLIEGALTRRAMPPDLGLLVSISALLSYAAASILWVGFRRSKAV